MQQQAQYSEASYAGSVNSHLTYSYLRLFEININIWGGVEREEGLPKSKMAELGKL